VTVGNYLTRPIRQDDNKRQECGDRRRRHYMWGSFGQRHAIALQQREIYARPLPL